MEKQSAGSLIKCILACISTLQICVQCYILTVGRYVWGVKAEFLQSPSQFSFHSYTFHLWAPCVTQVHIFVVVRVISFQMTLIALSDIFNVFFFFFCCCSSTVVSIFLSPLSPAPTPISHPSSYPPLALSMSNTFWNDNSTQLLDEVDVLKMCTYFL